MPEDVARTYGGYITYSELASRLVDATGIRTGQLKFEEAAVFPHLPRGEGLSISLAISAS